jgi:hypothetical protein
MEWYPTIVLSLGIFDAIAIMLGGLVTAFIVLMGWDAQKLWDRIWPALGILIGSNIAASIILTATHWLLK